MSCTHTRQMLDAWLDGELDSATSTEIQDHLARCHDCLALRAEREQLRAAIRAAPLRYPAPEPLRSAVTAHPRKDAGAGRGRPTWWQAASLAVAAGAACVVATVTFMRTAMVEPPRDQLRQQAVTRHVASLARASPVDVVSTDRHTVKPWFQGKVDFAPTVRDLKPQGFALQGGRLDRLAGQPAAALVYRIRNHPINLFVWRAGSTERHDFELVVLHGFSVATWTADGLHFAAVSDVDSRDLERFSSGMRRGNEAVN